MFISYLLALSAICKLSTKGRCCNLCRLASHSLAHLRKHHSFLYQDSVHKGLNFCIFQHIFKNLVMAILSYFSQLVTQLSDQLTHFSWFRISPHGFQTSDSSLSCFVVYAFWIMLAMSEKRVQNQQKMFQVQKESFWELCQNELRSKFGWQSPVFEKCLLVR